MLGHRASGSSYWTVGTSEAHDPEHLLSLRSSLESGDWLLDATYRHVSRIDNQSVPAHGELDLRGAWRPQRTWEISVVGQNLLHDHHAEFGANTPTSSNTRQEIERGVYAKVLWRQ